MRGASRAERTLRDAELRPDRASAEAGRGCIRFRQEPDTRTGVSSPDTPAIHESYPIRPDLTTPLSILGGSIALRTAWPSICGAAAHHRYFRPIARWPTWPRVFGYRSRSSETT